MAQSGPTSTTRPLGELVPAGAGEPQGGWRADLRVTGLSVDSREARDGHLFFALPGSHVHGGEFISFAARMGAAAIVTDAEGLRIARNEGVGGDLPILVTPEPRLDLARAAAAWSGAQPETVVAVTGTNGKTSVANFTRQIWEHLGERAVNFGTVGVEGAVSAPLSHTTPEPITLHALLAELAADGVTHAAMEASSHGLAQHRLDGVRLTAAGFTNITRDHMDYHHDFQDYFAAKLGLFDRVLPAGGTAVVNMDDPFGERVVRTAEERGISCLTIGRGEGNDITIDTTRFDAAGQDVRFTHAGQVHVARLALIGGFQAYNALTAAGLAIASGAAPDAAFKALDALTTVRGRMELVATRANGAHVFVDYAHTPDALATALNALRPHVMGRLVVVFGAGGDRDRGKRPLMGRAAAEGADVVIVTDDNPRGEDPAAIRAEIMEAVPEGTEIGDRAAAILAGVDALQPGDTLLIAGKGHETGQIVGDDVLPFNDGEQASVSVAALDGDGA
ncbi:UDP-N-acetylmuramoyl-L-alanyl-D-glutamate--2,6-diaminopimelate ligase [Oceanomicrobium pacificus]|uniref:UDP-N-acetylmuramoyl-L-alanyl-D-glutamate--2,6-diaminopimelate ligase n=1 Tax=Oceanomicrobium pacificus TaxID=2692916 RepID=A0A6B0TLK6_9RHOB|nr:UDP-N-acetylmuramoyl-L-alanyl-D-glutamate--2,6-diaminopimelate ligase [Oceanomicrobium pacificus]MXU65420.1 UDP-N-acetylmuramoyl-L-alanyl-D-glutamate--2,6-diaminopimelate ligase [Oceanomicrobium pacificus]